MWPAIATVCIAAITLMGYIAQRNIVFYRKIETGLFVVSLIVEAGFMGYLYGHGRGIEKAAELAETTAEKSELALLQYDESFDILLAILPILVVIITGFIGFTARQIQQVDQKD